MKNFFLSSKRGHPDKAFLICEGPAAGGQRAELSATLCSDPRGTWQVLSRVGPPDAGDGVWPTRKKAGTASAGSDLPAAAGGKGK